MHFTYRYIISQPKFMDFLTFRFKSRIILYFVENVDLVSSEMFSDMLTYIYYVHVCSSTFM